MANQFKEPNHYDHTIIDAAGKVVGHIRVKPNKILWSSKGSQKWRGVTLDKFAELMKLHGSDQAQ